MHACGHHMQWGQGRVNAHPVASLTTRVHPWRAPLHQPTRVNLSSPLTPFAAPKAINDCSDVGAADAVAFREDQKGEREHRTNMTALHAVSVCVYAWRVF